MAYSSFTLTQVMTQFAITVDTSRDLFGHIAPVPLGATARQSIQDNLQLALLIGNEKARSEFIVAQVLGELWRHTNRRISLFSGAALDVDPADGLNGVCDFLVGRAPQLPEVSPPLFVVVEAKKDDIQGAYGQCGAEMLAALRLNARSNTGVETIYGCVTTGTLWRFLRMTSTQLDIDVIEYHITQLDHIFGILLFMVAAALTPAAPRAA